MAINLSNVNISLNEFHRLSHGEYNAGEVKLAGETKLAKMNNHVGSFFANKEIISHEEVIAIKQALVKALSQNGVQEDALKSLFGLLIHVSKTMYFVRTWRFKNRAFREKLVFQKPCIS